MSKVALITGITGQDGSYLAELLLEKGYEVHGIVRRASLINTHRIDHIYEQIKLHYGDLTDAMSVTNLIKDIEPDDYVIATGEQYSVKDFVDKAAPFFGFNIEWMGEGDLEFGYDWNTKRKVIAVDKKYFRPAEVESLLGDASKAKRKLGWEPKISFDQLIEDMVLYGQ